MKHFQCIRFGWLWAVLAILNLFLSEHSAKAQVQEDPPFWVTFHYDTLYTYQVGDVTFYDVEVTATLYLGEESNPAEGIFGWELELTNQDLECEKFYLYNRPIEYWVDDSWLFDSATLMVEAQEDTNWLYWQLYRSDSIPQSGYGMIAKLNFIITIENIDGYSGNKAEAPVEQHDLVSTGLPESALVDPRSMEHGVSIISKGLQQVEVRTTQSNGEVQLIDMAGRVWCTRELRQGESVTLRSSAYPPGSYLVAVHTVNGWVTRKVCLRP